jgi:hypothetical protein
MLAEFNRNKSDILGFMWTRLKWLPILFGLYAITFVSPNWAATGPQLNCGGAQKEILSDSRLKDWESVYSSYRKFADCDDESLPIATAHGAAVGRLLTQNWSELATLNRLTLADKNFEQFVLRHMAELPLEPLRAVERQAHEACPSREERLCRLLDSRAEQLLIERKDPSAEESSAPECNLNQIDRWVGRAAISRGTKDAIDETLSCLFTLWRDDRSGSTKFVVSDAFLALMGENPSEFFLLMADEPKIFGQWVGNMDNLSFTWANDPPCQLETTRKRLISTLQYSETAPGRPASFKGEVVRKLTATRCRQIN